MPPRNQATATTEANREPVAQAENQLPAYLQDQQMAGHGVSTKSEDLLIPMARILQAMSPELRPQDPKSIPDAKVGDIYINNAPVPLIPGNKGFIFQPCHFSTAVVEWKPRTQGGGLVAKHPSMPDGAVERPNPERPEQMQMVNASNGNVYMDTRYHAGFLISPDKAIPPMPLYIPLSSSGHAISKAMMLLMSMKRFNGKPVDSFACYYDFKTMMRTRGPYTWSVFKISDAGPLDADGNPTTKWAPTAEDYERGMSLWSALEKNEMQFDESEAPVEDVARHSGARDPNVPF